ncbi:MAG TPA: hypothetical protein VIH22_17595 [Cyclobacteriaceae bacterium]|jgi:hypothetical protein
MTSQLLNNVVFRSTFLIQINEDNFSFQRQSIFFYLSLALIYALPIFVLVRQPDRRLACRRTHQLPQGLIRYEESWPIALAGVFTIANGIIAGYLWNRTRSLPLLVLLHLFAYIRIGL